MEDTFVMYKTALKAKYQEEKTEKNANFLFNPSPASLRNLALIVFEDITDPNDLKIFEHFMGFEYTENALGRIKNETDKFKPLGNFLKGETELSSYSGADMLAVLLDSKPRPYAHFHKKNKEVEPPDESLPISTSSVLITGHSQKIESKKNKRKSSALLSISTGILTLVGGIIYSNKDHDENNCMVWNIDHYQAVDCDDTQQSFMYSAPVHADEKLLTNFRKISVDSNTRFFDAKKQPLIWYGKNANKEYEYFTLPGLHPETGKTLKPISTYIIKKYIK